MSEFLKPVSKDPLWSADQKIVSEQDSLRGQSTVDENGEEVERIIRSLIADFPEYDSSTQSDPNGHSGYSNSGSNYGSAQHSGEIMDITDQASGTTSQGSMPQTSETTVVPVNCEPQAAGSGTADQVQDFEIEIEELLQSDFLGNGTSVPKSDVAPNPVMQHVPSYGRTAGVAHPVTATSIQNENPGSTQASLVGNSQLHKMHNPADEEQGDSQSTRGPPQRASQGQLSTCPIENSSDQKSEVEFAQAVEQSQQSIGPENKVCPVAPTAERQNDRDILAQSMQEANISAPAPLMQAPAKMAEPIQESSNQLDFECAQTQQDFANPASEIPTVKFVKASKTCDFEDGRWKIAHDKYVKLDLDALRANDKFREALTNITVEKSIGLDIAIALKDSPEEGPAFKKGDTAFKLKAHNQEVDSSVNSRKDGLHKVYMMVSDLNHLFLRFLYISSLVKGTNAKSKSNVWLLLVKIYKLSKIGPGEEIGLWKLPFQVMAEVKKLMDTPLDSNIPDWVKPQNFSDKGYMEMLPNTKTEIKFNRPQGLGSSGANLVIEVPELSNMKSGLSMKDFLDIEDAPIISVVKEMRSTPCEVQYTGINQINLRLKKDSVNSLSVMCNLNPGKIHRGTKGRDSPPFMLKIDIEGECIRIPFKVVSVLGRSKEKRKHTEKNEETELIEVPKSLAPKVKQFLARLERELSKSTRNRDGQKKPKRSKYSTPEN